MVSDTRIELVTSSVSGKRSSAELITRENEPRWSELPFACRGWGNSCLSLLKIMVSDTRIELVTSSVSGKRSSAELITHATTRNRVDCNVFNGNCQVPIKKFRIEK